MPEFFNKAVFLDLDSMGSGLNLDCLKPLAQHWDLHPVTPADQTLQRIIDADLVCSNKVVLSRQILQQCSRLKLVCIAATGINNIDLAAARELGIAVTNVTAYGTASVVQHVFALLLSLTNRLNEHQQSTLNGQWQQSPYFCVLDYPFRELAGKTFGIIGFGELGKGVAKIAQAFGMTVIVASRPGDKELKPGRLPFNEVLRRSDVISLHVPLAENTANMISTDQFALMKNDAILINTARGGIVDELALLEALKSGQIAAAGFDVLDKEPPVEGNCLLRSDLTNLIITPHVAWAATESRQRLIHLMADNIKAFVNGKMLNRVDKS